MHTVCLFSSEVTPAVNTTALSVEYFEMLPKKGTVRRPGLASFSYSMIINNQITPKITRKQAYKWEADMQSIGIIFR